MTAAAATLASGSDTSEFCGACVDLAGDQAITCLDCVLSAESSKAANACNGVTSTPLQRAPVTNSVPSAEAELAGEQEREQG